MSIAQSTWEALTRDAYLALLWSLSYPGRAHTLPAGSDAGSWANESAFLTIAHTLLDLETSFFCPDHPVAQRLSESGARERRVEDAAYVFLPVLDAQAIALIECVKVGTFANPDKGATIITSASFDSGALMTWSGPGIQTPRRVMLDVPSPFWDARAARIRYPLGIDVYFADHNRVIGLPRTTLVDLGSTEVR